jgi:hypothetical protein
VFLFWRWASADIGERWQGDMAEEIAQFKVGNGID